MKYAQRYSKALDDDPAAYKMIGQCYGKLKSFKNQFEAYKRSLNLNAQQNDLLIEVCKLLQNNELTDSSEEAAKYWWELAESRNIYHLVVLSLKLKFMDVGDLASIRNIILSYIDHWPFDVTLRGKLVQHLLDANQVEEAFKYVMDIEMNLHNQFKDSTEWIATVSMVLENYKKKTAESFKVEQYWYLQCMTVERKLCWNLMQPENGSSELGKSLLHATKLLFELDQLLQAAATDFNAEKLAKSSTEFDSEFCSIILTNFVGQWCLHAASLLFKRQSDQEYSNWQNSTEAALPLLLIAYNCGIDENIQYSNDVDLTKKCLTHLCKLQSYFRLVQAGRTIRTTISISISCHNTILVNLQKMYADKFMKWTNKYEVLAEVRSFVSNLNWRTRLYEQLFPFEQVDITKSLMMKNEIFGIKKFEWPEKNELRAFELLAQQINSSELSHLIYLIMYSEDHDNSKVLHIVLEPSLKIALFNGLSFSTTSPGDETLNKLDIALFWYATMLHSQRAINNKNQMLLKNSPVLEFNKPRILPYANMVKIMCTREQSEWWRAAHQVCMKSFNRIQN